MLQDSKSSAEQMDFTGMFYFRKNWRLIAYAREMQEAATC